MGAPMPTAPPHAILGPAAVAIPFADPAEAIRLAKAARFGPAGY